MTSAARKTPVRFAIPARTSAAEAMTPTPAVAQKLRRNGGRRFVAPPSTGLHRDCKPPAVQSPSPPTRRPSTCHCPSPEESLSARHQRNTLSVVKLVGASKIIQRPNKTSPLEIPPTPTGVPTVNQPGHLIAPATAPVSP